MHSDYVKGKKHAKPQRRSGTTRLHRINGVPPVQADVAPRARSVACVTLLGIHIPRVRIDGRPSSTEAHVDHRQ